MPPADCFCEECGQRMTGSPVHGATACARCGAGPETVDADGFCSACGVRREAQERDRVEFVLSPDFAGVSDRGLNHHRNEDFLAMLLAPAGTRVLVVCDGVSNTIDADRASQAAAESAVRMLARGASMEAAIAAAQKAVAGLRRNRSSGADSPATTIVAAVITQSSATRIRVTVGWLGDSRAYWIGQGKAVQLTRDHSWLLEVVESGEMQLQEALRSSNAHAITRWLGADAPVDSPAAIVASIVNMELAGPGCLLLCTDGLWNYASEPESIAELVRPRGDAITKARAMINFANAHGGHDNITAALLTL